MDTQVDRLKRLLETLRTIGFWRRLFNWSAVRDQLVDATADLQKLLTNQDNLSEQLRQQREQMTLSRRELEYKIQELQRAKETVLELKGREEQRQADHSKMAATLKSIQDNIIADREAELQQEQTRKLQHLANLRFTWSNHQQHVRQTIKALCLRHTIEYVDKAPFKGEPDNVVHIAGELIVFDAKSPRGEDLDHFPAYLREQAEKAKKYAGEPDVRKWIFFVVPQNTLAHLAVFVHHLADYQVFVVAVDSLEPILLSLKKVEEYEFAENLSPEDRENICRILGKFAHLSKRRIQIDTYFINQFMELARKCENDLPSEILREAVEFERAEKLNPPLEKRAKTIPIAELERSARTAVSDAANHGVLPANDQLAASLNMIPLYAEDK